MWAKEKCCGDTESFIMSNLFVIFVIFIEINIIFYYLYGKYSVYKNVGVVALIHSVWLFY